MSVHNLTRPIVGIENRTAQEVFDIMRARILSALEPSADACPCTKIQQDETCPVGYPSLLCEICGGKGVVQPSVAREQALADLEEIQRAVFGTLGSEPDVYADYDRLCELSRKMREAIRSLSSPDHADAGKVEGDGIERSEFNRGYVMACSNIVNLHGPDVNVAEGFAQLCISKDELKSLNLDDYDQRAIDELEEFWGADKLFSRPLPSTASEGGE